MRTLEKVQDAVGEYVFVIVLFIVVGRGTALTG
jgi:hypothetical protein